jgi:hypothetical protein
VGSRHSAAPAHVATRFVVVLSLLSAAGVAHAATLSRGPYLQQVTTTSALVVWRTTEAAACTLTATRAGQPPIKVMTASGTQHVATLTGLQPGTHYDYSIRGGGPLASGSDCFLQTAPLPNSGATTRFLVFGDTGTGSSTQMAVAAQINAQTVQFGLHVGDIIYPGGEAHYYNPRYFGPYAPLLRHTPIWAAIGNHDEVTPSSFIDAWYLPTNPVNGSERFYSFDYGDIHMVALDTTEPFSTAILDWLRNDLAASSRRWKFVFFHHTVYSCGQYHGSSTSLISLLTPIFEDYGVDLVMYGHDHHYERSYPMRDGEPVGVATDPDYVLPGAPIYVISGAGGTTRSSGTTCSHTARAISTPSFVRVEVQDADLTLEAIGADGQTLDRMTLSKGDAPPPPPPVDTVVVIAPNGGEVTTINGSLDLRWTASPEIALVRLELSRTSASGPWETLAQATTNDGHESWIVSGSPSPTCWLRVCDATDGTPSDLSDASFVIVSAPEPPPPGTEVVRVNFQPANAVVPATYVVDSGATFTTARGYGWNTTQEVVARNLLIADPRDTFVDIVNSTSATWELVVPNGTYHVSITCGDPQTSGTHRVALEGQLVIDDMYTLGGEFVQQANLPVNVSDGRLTLVGGGAGGPTHTKINAIVVAPANGPSQPYVLETPSPGETRCLGITMSISWKGSGAAAPLRLELSRAGVAGPWEIVGPFLVDDGNESVTPFGAPSTDCRFRLLDASGAVLDMTDGAFRLASPQLQMLAPNGGETWIAGTQHNFAWTSTCFMGAVRLDVSRSGANGPWITLVPTTANDGVEPWIVSESDVGWTHARVVALPFLEPGDGSDAPFSVYDPNLAPASWDIDFTVPGAPETPGITLDTGLPFDAERGFGWYQSVLMRKRDMMPGDCRDSFVQVVNNVTATWEIALPNGAYRVSAVCGDPFTSGTHRVLVEDKLLVADVYAIGGTFVTRNDAIRVNDGRLTVQLGGSGAITSTKLACLKIEASNSPPRRAPRTPPQTSPVTKVDVGPTRIDFAPGPLRGPSDIAFALATAGHVRLSVHDVRGRRVAMLVDRDLAVGRHVLRWDLVDGRRQPLASGVYFLQLEAPDKRENRKLVVVR